jgi:hypothetical protein
MAVPLVTVLAVTGINLPAALTVLAIIAGFLAHEPLLVLLGRRGARAHRQRHRAAVWWFATATAIAVASGGAAVWMTPADLRWTFAVPLVPAALLLFAISRRREKTGYAEIAVALTFSLAAVPVCLVAGGTLATAASIAAAFGLIFVAGTLAVRLVILKVRGGGNPQATSLTRAAALTWTVIGAAILAATAAVAVLPWSAPLAAAPGLAIAAGVALSPPAPTRLRVLGWRLVGASVAAAIVIIVAEWRQ